MFSTAQQEYIDSFVPTMIHQGYSSYIVYSNTNINSGYYTTAIPDLIFIFSKDKIEASDSYTFTIPADSVKYEVRTPNYSTSQTAINTERIEYSPISGSLVIPIYEHIYTNAAFEGYSIQPDILKEGSQNNAIQTQSVCLALCAFLLVFCFWKMWTLHR